MSETEEGGDVSEQGITEETGCWVQNKAVCACVRVRVCVCVQMFVIYKGQREPALVNRLSPSGRAGSLQGCCAWSVTPAVCSSRTEDRCRCPGDSAAQKGSSQTGLPGVEGSRARHRMKHCRTHERSTVIHPAAFHTRNSALEGDRKARILENLLSELAKSSYSSPSLLTAWTEHIDDINVKVALGSELVHISTPGGGIHMST